MKKKILKQSCKNFSSILVIGSDNQHRSQWSMTSTEGVHLIVHNSVTQNRNRLKFWILDFYVDDVLMTLKDNDL